MKVSDTLIYEWVWVVRAKNAKEALDFVSNEIPSEEDPRVVSFEENQANNTPWEVEEVPNGR